MKMGGLKTDISCGYDGDARSLAQLSGGGEPGRILLWHDRWHRKPRWRGKIEGFEQIAGRITFCKRWYVPRIQAKKADAEFHHAGMRVEIVVDPLFGVR